MNKGRLEAFSDGVFAIVMTLLVFDIKVPELARPVAEAKLIASLADLFPLIFVYAVTFIILAVTWINHHAIFHYFAKEVDRRLNVYNMVYLMFVAFVPFSAHLIGSFHESRTAVIVYGFNMLAIFVLSFVMVTYILNNDHLSHDQLSDRLIRQARFRSGVSLAFYSAGIIAAFFWIPASVFLFAFPIIFNFIPGTVDAVEKWGLVDFG